MTQRTLLLAAVAGFVLVNGGAFLVVKAAKGTASAPAPAPAVQAAPSEELQRRKRDEEEGHRRRAAGLAALEAADYEKALINLTEAKVLLGDSASVDQLLKVTEDLRHRAVAPGTPPAPGPAAPEPAAPAPATEDAALRAKAAPRPGPARPAPVRPAGPQVAAARDTGGESRGGEAPRPGLLLVTTTPRGILVQVDGAAVDLTPMRLSLRPGSHRVVLLDGERRLHETQVEVVEGQATTVLRDVSAELGSARAAEAPARPPALAPEPAGEAPRQGPAPEEVAPAAGPPVGGLSVSSPGLYAEVWINGRSYGFPPVTARELPAGLARIEMRVNGAVKRRAEVEVVAGQVQQVKVR